VVEVAPFLCHQTVFQVTTGDGDPVVAMASETALERTFCAKGVLPMNLGERFGLRTCLPASRQAAAVAGATSPTGAAALAAGAAATAARGVLRRARSKGTLVTVGNHIKLFWASITERPTPNTGGSTHMVSATSNWAAIQLRHISWI
jgi:hypothetical protein